MSATRATWSASARIEENFLLEGAVRRYEWIYDEHVEQQG